MVPFVGVVRDGFGVDETDGWFRGVGRVEEELGGVVEEGGAEAIKERYKVRLKYRRGWGWLG